MATHHRLIEVLERKVRKLEAKKQELEHLGREDLHKLTLVRKDLEGRLRSRSDQGGEQGGEESGGLEMEEGLDRGDLTLAEEQEPDGTAKKDAVKDRKRAQQGQKLEETEGANNRVSMDLENRVADENKVVGPEEEERTDEMEESIRKKSWELQNLGARQRSEEALLEVWSDAVSDKVRRLRDEALAKQGQHSANIGQLEEALLEARREAELQQRNYEEVKEETESKLLERRGEFESHILAAATRLRELASQIVELKLTLSAKEEANKDQAANNDKTIQDEANLVVAHLVSLEKQLDPLRNWHLELKEQLEQSKRNHALQIRDLQEQQRARSAEQEQEVNKLLGLLESTRAQFKGERLLMQEALGVILEDNDNQRQKFQKEIFEMNNKLVQTLAGDREPVAALLDKVNELQIAVAAKSRQYEDLRSKHDDEKYGLNHKKEQLGQPKQWLAKMGKVSSILPERKESVQESSETIHLLEELDAARSQHADLYEKLQQKKTKLRALISQQQAEEEDTTKECDDQRNEPYDYGETSPKLDGTLRMRPSNLATLREKILAEAKERERLMTEIARLEKEKPIINHANWNENATRVIGRITGKEMSVQQQGDLSSKL